MFCKGINILFLIIERWFRQKSDLYDEEVDVSIKRDTEDERAEIQYKQEVQRSMLYG